MSLDRLMTIVTPLRVVSAKEKSTFPSLVRNLSAVRLRAIGQAVVRFSKGQASGPVYASN
jgi:glycerol-3-phosphate O-acyltransferase